MWKVTKGNFILNVPVEGGVKNHYEGDKLPDDYKPPQSYIINGIVEEIKKKAVRNEL